jgi:uncharacterized protein YaaQ
LIAIVQDYDCDKLLRTVASHGYRATRIASTGGFLRAGNTTVFMGIEDDRVPQCVDLIRQSCQTRTEVKLETVSEYSEWFPAGVHEVTIGGAVVFVADVSRFVRIPASAAVGHVS